MAARTPSLIERGFRRGWADATEGHPSQALRFWCDFLTGYHEGYRRGQQAKVEKKSLEECLQEWKG